MGKNPLKLVHSEQEKSGGGSTSRYAVKGRLNIELLDSTGTPLNFMVIELDRQELGLVVDYSFGEGQGLTLVWHKPDGVRLTIRLQVRSVCHVSVPGMNRRVFRLQVRPLDDRVWNFEALARQSDQIVLEPLDS